MNQQIGVDDTALSDWLDSLSSVYKQRATYSIKTFFKFLSAQGWEDVTCDLILKRHQQNRKSDENKTKYEFDDLLPAFVAWLVKQRGVSHNTAVISAAVVRGFFKFHREPLQIQNGKIKTIEKKKGWHTFSRDELSKMISVGDLEEKVIILLAKDLGIRVGDFVKLQRKPILEAYKDQNGEFPIEFEIETQKRGAIAVGHIMEETWNILQLYWKRLSKSDYIFPSNVNGRVHISEQHANDVLKNTWVKAFPDRPDVKIRFHELRSYKMSVLSNAGVNQWHIKQMVGKTIAPEIKTYLTGINLKDDFIKAQPALTLTTGLTNENHSRLKTLEERNEQLITEVQLQKEVLKDTIKELTAENLELKREISEVKQVLHNTERAFNKTTDKLLSRIKSLERNLEFEITASRPPHVLDLINMRFVTLSKKLGVSQDDIDDVLAIVREEERKKQKQTS